MSDSSAMKDLRAKLDAARNNLALARNSVSQSVSMGGSGIAGFDPNGLINATAAVIRLERELECQLLYAGTANTEAKLRRLYEAAVNTQDADGASVLLEQLHTAVAATTAARALLDVALRQP